MSIALDIGSHRVSSLRFDGERLVARDRRCVFAVLPDTAAHQQLLAQAHVDSAVCDDGLLLLGDAAWDNAELFHVHARSLLTNGALPEHDPVSRQLMATLIEAVLPKASVPGELCALTTPGSGGSRNEAARSDLDFFNRIVRLQGYEPMLVPTPSALTLAELANQGFTGIAVVCGASCCEAAVVHRGVAVCQSRHQYGGDWIDGRIAESLGLMSWDSAGDRFVDQLAATRLREARPSGGRGFSIGALRRDKQAPSQQLAESSEFADVLRSSLLQILCELMTDFSVQLARTHQGRDLPQPIAVVCGGGLAMTPGFVATLDEAMGTVEWNLALQPPRVSLGWPFNTTRGLLIAAELEAQAEPQRRAVA